MLEPDLAGQSDRSLAFTPPAVTAARPALFGFPLQVGGIRLGALNLYRDRPGEMSDYQSADASSWPVWPPQAVLAMQAQAQPGTLAAELEDGADFRFVVHQASGMVAVQLGVSVAEALVRLRAFAFANDRLVTEVAEDVVGRRLRFDGGGPGVEP